MSEITKCTDIAPFEDWENIMHVIIESTQQYRKNPQETRLQIYGQKHLDNYFPGGEICGFERYIESKMTQVKDGDYDYTYILRHGGIDDQQKIKKWIERTYYIEFNFKSTHILRILISITRWMIAYYRVGCGLDVNWGFNQSIKQKLNLYKLQKNGRHEWIQKILMSPNPNEVLNDILTWRCENLKTLRKYEYDGFEEDIIHYI
jgi:hypothetical protein